MLWNGVFNELYCVINTDRGERQLFVVVNIVQFRYLITRGNNNNKIRTEVTQFYCNTAALYAVGYLVETIKQEDGGAAKFAIQKIPDGGLLQYFCREVH